MSINYFDNEFQALLESSSSLVDYDISLALGEEGLKLLYEAREEFDMPVFTEVLSVRDVELVAQYSDILQLLTIQTITNY